MGNHSCRRCGWNYEWTIGCRRWNDFGSTSFCTYCYKRRPDLPNICQHHFAGLYINIVNSNIRDTGSISASTPLFAWQYPGRYISCTHSKVYTNQVAAPLSWNFDHMGWNTLFMLKLYIIPVFIGILLGYLAGLGVGGGSLLIMWLTLVMDTDVRPAQIINLLFFLTAAGCATFLRVKKGTLQIRAIIPGILSGCLFAVIFSFIGKAVSQSLLQKLFGIVLLFTGVREIFYRTRKAK